MNPAEFANIAALEENFWWFRGMRQILWSFLDPYEHELRGKRWLEAGCGTGYQAARLEERYGCDVTGLDLGHEGLRHAISAGRGNLVEADIRRLPLQDNSFDGLLSLDVLVHLERGEEIVALREFCRVVRPEGLVCLRVSALDILRSRHSEFAFERQRFTKGRLVDRLREAGFRIVRSTYANSLLLPVALAKFRLWEPLTRQQPTSGVAPVPAWLNESLAQPLHAEAWCIARGWDFSLGQSLLVLARKEQS